MLKFSCISSSANENKSYDKFSNKKLKNKDTIIYSNQIKNIISKAGLKILKNDLKIIKKDIKTNFIENLVSSVLPNNNDDDNIQNNVHDESSLMEVDEDSRYNNLTFQSKFTITRSDMENNQEDQNQQELPNDVRNFN